MDGSLGKKTMLFRDSTKEQIVEARRDNSMQRESLRLGEEFYFHFISLNFVRAYKVLFCNRVSFGFLNCV